MKIVVKCALIWKITLIPRITRIDFLDALFVLYECWTFSTNYQPHEVFSINSYEIGMSVHYCLRKVFHEILIWLLHEKCQSHDLKTLSLSTSNESTIPSCHCMVSTHSSCVDMTRDILLICSCIDKS